MISRLPSAALAGLAAGAVGLAVSQVGAVFAGPASDPITGVGGLAIDLAPPLVKNAVVQAFGTGDKSFLVTVVLVVVGLAGVLAGVLEVRRRFAGLLVVAVLAAVATTAVMTRAQAGALSWWPTIAGMLLAAFVLVRGARLARAHVASRERRAGGATAVERRASARGSGDASRRVRPTPASSADYDRRSFFGFVGILGGIAVLVGSGARSLTAAAAGVVDLRAGVSLPEPSASAAAVPDGADLSLDGLTPYATSADAFYRIDTALRVPAVDPSTWRLKVTGMVDHEVELGFDELLRLPLEEHWVTLACVSNTVGGDLIGNARWLGYPVRLLLERAGVHPDADMVLSRSVDGFSAGTPLDALTDPDRAAIVAVGMNGKPLPIEHGFPARIVVPGLYGYVSATKWVSELTVTRFSEDEGYWTPRGWSARGPVKTEARIDRPRTGQRVARGTYRIAGIAWDQHTGIRSVEVKVDDGPWRAATLAATVGPDTWRQWYLDADLSAGDHTIVARATNADGETQTADEAPPAPNGASGYPSVDVSVA